MIKKSLFVSTGVALALAFGFVRAGAEPIDIGARLELFVDDYLIEDVRGDAQLRLHKPKEHDVVFTPDAAWEKGNLGYIDIFKDQDIYRMYYTTGDPKTGSFKTCYAESVNGVNWTKPDLGLFRYEGAGTNILLQRSGSPRDAATPIHAGDNWTGVFPGETVTGFFKDANPSAASDAKYKAVGEFGPHRALVGFKSPDGIHWTLVNNGNPIFVPDGQIKVGTRHFFDSQNVVFWDRHQNAYRMYFREYDGTRRIIRTLMSTDFENWNFSESKRLVYPGLPDSSSGDQSLLIAGKQNLYTNATLPYERAPHVIIGFPTYKSDYEFNDAGAVVASNPRWDEPLFMSSRDGRTFQRDTEAIIPRDTEARRHVYGNFAVRGLVRLPGNDLEYAIYGHEGAVLDGLGRMRLWTYRIDGFRSLCASKQGGEIITKPIIFAGGDLQINFATRDGGTVKVEIQDLSGNAIGGFALADCKPISGDAIEKQVSWESGSDVGALAGIPVRLRFVLKDADLYSFRFVQVVQPR